MVAKKMSTIRVEKPWGRHNLWPGFANPGPNKATIGEIWFDAHPELNAALLIKYLFTSERLSIQVHPDDAAARAAGHPHGKDEAWIILHAEPGAVIALGTKYAVTADTLHQAADDGSIESLVDWKPVKAGDVIYVPAGTVHAIGAGITLIEVQQNVDLTYRLYDYGRPRPLHLDAGIAVSNPQPFTNAAEQVGLSSGRSILVESPNFIIEQWQGQGVRAMEHIENPVWLVPIIGTAWVGGDMLTAGECWIVDTDCRIETGEDTRLLLAYQGGSRLALS